MLRTFAIFLRVMDFEKINICTQNSQDLYLFTNFMDKIVQNLASDFLLVLIMTPVETRVLGLSFSLGSVGGGAPAHTPKTNITGSVCFVN